MSRLGFRAASVDDAPRLACMNRHLIDDEGSRNPMDHAALQERMRGWLENDWRAIIILADSEPAGYCVYQERCDEYDAAQPVIYVRQFFVARDHRREGIGRRAFGRMTDVIFPDDAILELDVLASNKAGQAFWADLGFEPHQVLAKRQARTPMAEG